jgi:hypothetical protein
LLQYLDKNSITDLTEENFSFNANVNVGQFWQQVTAKDVGFFFLSLFFIGLEISSCTSGVI